MFDKTKRKQHIQKWNAYSIGMPIVWPCMFVCVWILNLVKFFTLFFSSFIFASYSLFFILSPSPMCHNFLAILVNLPFHQFFKRCQVRFTYLYSCTLNNWKEYQSENVQCVQARKFHSFKCVLYEIMPNEERKKRQKDTKIPINWSHCMCANAWLAIFHSPFALCVHTKYYIACNAKQWHTNRTTTNWREHLLGIINSVAYIFFLFFFVCGPNRVEKMLSHFTLLLFYFFCAAFFFPLSLSICVCMLLPPIRIAIFSSFISIRFVCHLSSRAHLTQ